MLSLVKHELLFITSGPGLGLCDVLIAFYPFGG